MERIGLTASEEMLFENAEGRMDGRLDGWTPGTCLYSGAYGSGELKSSCSHDQDGHHAHIWLKPSKSFSSSEPQGHNFLLETSGRASLRTRDMNLK